MTSPEPLITVDERVSVLLRDVASIKQETLIDKHRFIELLNWNFVRIDTDGSRSISKAEILEALESSGNYTTEESITLLILLRYFEFISTIVEGNTHGELSSVSQSDIDTLASFLLHSDMTLEAFCQWCGGRVNDELGVSADFTGSELSASA